MKRLAENSARPSRGAALLAALLLGAVLGCGAPGRAAAEPNAQGPLAVAPAPARTPLETITAAELEADVRFLASDELAGRETGSEGGDVASRGIARRLASAGVTPGGDGGLGEAAFLQRTPISGWQPAGDFELGLLTGAGQEAPVAAADFVVARAGILARTLELVVVRTAAELPHVARPDAALLVLADGRTRREWLVQAGAPDGRGWGLLLVAAGETARRPPEVSREHAVGSLEPGGAPPLIVLFGEARERVSSGDVRRVRVALRGQGLRSAHNVIGVVRGVGTASRPELAEQALVISAHYDHIGLAPAAVPSAVDATDVAGASDESGDEDRICNGADDDASGVAAVLELAEAFAARAAAGTPPARTLVFLLATGEEHGLLGTQHYLEAPTVPLAQTVANVNFEMIGRPDALAGGAGRLWLTGFERTNLGPAWAALGLPIVPDARPDQHFYERSDNIAFVRKGIVGQTLSSYSLHADYHTPADEADLLDYLHMEEAVRASYLALLPLADGELDPAWAER